MSLYDNLVAYYKFESTLIDETGNHIATDPFTAASYVSGPKGYGVQTNLYLQLQNTFNEGYNNGFSFLGWINLNNSTEENRTIFQLSRDIANGAQSIILRQDEDTQDLLFYCLGTSPLRIPNVIEFDNWQHIGIILTPYTESLFKLDFYINTIKQTTYNSSNNPVDTVTRIGTDTSYWSFPYNYLGRLNTIITRLYGSLDDIKFYNVSKIYTDVLLDYMGSPYKKIRLKHWDGTQYKPIVPKTNTPLQIKAKII